MGLLNPATVLTVDDVIDVSPSVLAAEAADDDVIIATEEISNFYTNDARKAIIQSIVVIDEDDNGAAIELVFLNASGSVGNENAAYAPADAVLRTIVGTVLVESGDYSDAANGQTATKTSIGLMVKAGSTTSNSIYVAAVNRSGSAKTYTAAGLRFKIGILRS